MNRENLLLGASLLTVAVGYAVVGFFEAQNGDSTDNLEAAVLFGSSALMALTGYKVAAMDKLVQEETFQEFENSAE